MLVRIERWRPVVVLCTSVVSEAATLAAIGEDNFGLHNTGEPASRIESGLMSGQTPARPVCDAISGRTCAHSLSMEQL